MDIVAIGSHLPVNLRVVALAGASRQAARNKVLAVKQVLRMSVTLRKGLRKVFGKLLSVIGPWHPWPWKGRVQIGCGSRSEEHTSELQSLMRISYAVFCLKK